MKQELAAGLVALTLVVMLAAGWLLRAMARLRAEHAAARDALQAQLAQSLGDAARLPDAQERCARAESALAETREALQARAAAEAALRAQADAATRQLGGLEGAVEASARRTAELQAVVDASHREVASMRSAVEASAQSIDRLAAEKAALAEELAAAREAAAALQREHAHADAERRAALAAHAQTKAFLEEAQARLRQAFAEVAGKLLDEKSVALDQRIKESGEASRVGLEGTLKPFAEQLGSFRTRFEEIRAEQAKDQATLVGTIGELKTLNQHMADSTDGLAKALKGNAKTRGDWGEMILETVLKASGLVEGTHFRRQESNRDDESGKLLRPDVVVNLPDGRQLVVDSKVNLVAWAEANNADSHEAQQDALIRHAAALRAHVKDLSEKNYPRTIGKDALDLTVLFVPIEGALAAALSITPDLQSEAFGKRVVFASPNTLMAMLTVVNRLWTRDRLQRQVGVIGEEAGKVLDALSAFLDEFGDVEQRLNQAVGAYAKAKHRLLESDQSVTARARRLVEAGARGKRALNSRLEPDLDPGALPLPLVGLDE